MLLFFGYLIKLMEVEIGYRLYALSTFLNDFFDLGFNGLGDTRKAVGHVRNLGTQLTLGIDNPRPVGLVCSIGSLPSFLEHDSSATGYIASVAQQSVT